MHANQASDLTGVVVASKRSHVLTTFSPTKATTLTAAHMRSVMSQVRRSKRQPPSSFENSRLWSRLRV
jgi:hypothetical protein